MEARAPSSALPTAPPPGPEVTAAAALAICESLMLALNDRKVLPEREIIGILQDADDLALGQDFAVVERQHKRFADGEGRGRRHLGSGRRGSRQGRGWRTGLHVRNLFIVRPRAVRPSVLQQSASQLSQVWRRRN